MECEPLSSSTLTFTAIKQFVSDLWLAFPVKNSPLALYHRLMQHTNDSNSNVATEKSVAGFKVFFVNFDEILSSDEGLQSIPRDTVIRYGESPKVYLEIQKYIYKASPEQRTVIRQHLLTISATIDPDEKKLSSLSNSAAPVLEKMGLGGSAESRFVKNIVDKAKKSMEGMDMSNIKDPTSAILALAQGGVIADMMRSVETQMQSGPIDPAGLMEALQENLSTAFASAGADGEASKIDVGEIINTTQQMLTFNSTTTTISTHDTKEEYDSDEDIPPQ